MKKNLMMTAIAAVTLTAGAAFASSSSNYDAKKIGIVNVEKVFSNSSQAQKAKDSLKSKMQSKQKQLKSEQKELQKLMKKMHRNSSTMSKSDKKKLKQKIQSKQKDLQQKEQQFQQQAQQDKSSAMESIIDKIQKATKNVAHEKHLDVVLSNTATMYASDKYNITDAVQKELKKLKS